MRHIIFVGLLTLSAVLADYCLDETKVYAESRFQAEVDFKKTLLCIIKDGL